MRDVKYNEKKSYIQDIALKSYLDLRGFSPVEIEAQQGYSTKICWFVYEIEKIEMLKLINDYQNSDLWKFFGYINQNRTLIHHTIKNI